MIRLNSPSTIMLRRASAKRALYFLIFCLCLLCSGFILAGVQASVADDAVGGALTAGSNIAVETSARGAADPDQTDAPEEEESSSDQPGATEDHNSNGDDVLVHIVR